jgi:hypothetical protein
MNRAILDDEAARDAAALQHPGRPPGVSLEDLYRTRFHSGRKVFDVVARVFESALHAGRSVPLAPLRVAAEKLLVHLSGDLALPPKQRLREAYTLREPEPALGAHAFPIDRTARW